MLLSDKEVAATDNRRRWSIAPTKRERLCHWRALQLQRHPLQWIGASSRLSPLVVVVVYALF
jgi:hypothetical protein